MFFFFKQKTAYEMRISDWSSDVCSSDLLQFGAQTGNGSPIVNSKNFQFGIYIQDDWEVTDRLTLNLGVRWDYERTPAFLDFVHPADAVNAVSPANYPNLINADYDINDFISTGSERKAFMGAWQPRIGFSSQPYDEARYLRFCRLRPSSN